MLYVTNSILPQVLYLQIDRFGLCTCSCMNVIHCAATVALADVQLRLHIYTIITCRSFMPRNQYLLKLNFVFDLQCIG